MNVHELVQVLQKWPNQEATVVIGEGLIPERWLLVCGLVERQVALVTDNPDEVGSGRDPAVEIV